MEFFVIGINHHKTPIEIRERLSFRDTDIIEFTEKFAFTKNSEIVILSTCNRSEIYIYSDNITKDELWNYIEKYFKTKIDEEYRFYKMGTEALRHLFYVAIGLDSMVVGEDQIQGQVINAYETAKQLGGAKKYLNKVMREVISFSKYVKTTSHASDMPSSTAYLGIRMIEDKIQLLNKKALIIGIGQMGMLAYKYLAERGADISIANRTYENSIKFKGENEDINIILYSDVNKYIRECEVVVVATASPHTILDEGDFIHSSKKTYVLDLSVPRGVDENAGDLPNVELYDIDSINMVAKENLKEKEKILKAYAPEIEDKIEEILTWEENTRMDPVFNSAQNYIERLANDTVSYIKAKTNISSHELRKVEKIVRYSINKASREPLIYAKEMEPSKMKDDVIKFFEEIYNED